MVQNQLTQSTIHSLDNMISPSSKLTNNWLLEFVQASQIWEYTEEILST